MSPAGWAREALTAKKSLTGSDANVEGAFERRLSELPSFDVVSARSNPASLKSKWKPLLARQQDPSVLVRCDRRRLLWGSAKPP
jgi:hypothetical protein